MTETFIGEVEGFREFGRVTGISENAGIRYLTNEFWTARQRQSHPIHEISYRACFKAQLPEFFIGRLTAPGDSVFDPFMGRGTTPLQAALMGRAAHGNDVNPLSAMMARPRLQPPEQADVEAALASADWESGEIGREDLLVFYHPSTLRKLEALRAWIAEREGDPVADWIRLVALSRLSGHSPGFFSVMTMPPNQAVSARAQERMNEKSGRVPPERDVAALIARKSKALLRDGGPPAVPRSLHTGPAWAVPGMGDASADLMVTSPPFLDVVQYAADNWLRCWFAGIDPDSVEIDMHRTEGAWTGMMRRVLAETARIVRPGGHAAVEVGEVRGGAVLLDDLVLAAAEGLPFEILCVMVNDQEFTKTANCWGVDNGAKGTNTNRIVVMRRTSEAGR